MLIRNNTRKAKYFCVKRNRFIDLSEKILSIEMLNRSSLEAHKKNCKFLSLNPYHYIPVIAGIYPIPPKTSWYYHAGKFSQIQNQFIDTTIDYDVSDIHHAAHLYLKRIKGRLAVELSGGLDTSIVIGLLRDINVDPYLIGAESSRFEFRTERFIQKKVATDPNKTHLFADTEGLPFVNLLDTPTHFLPNKSSLFYHSNVPTLHAAKDMGVTTILNGIGLDSLLIDAVGPPNKHYWFDISNLDDGWANDYVFEPNGISYVNVGTMPFVRKILISLRKNQREDLQKLWARAFFKEQIPEELSQFAYKASFGAVYYQGLEASREEILSITSTIYSLTGLPEYLSDSMNRLIDSVLSFDYESEFLFFGLLSYAVWVHQLKRDNLIVSACN